jgi:hypothetical protein
MNKPFLIRLCFCFLVFGVCLYSHIDKQNALTVLSISLPTITKEIRALKEENTRLQYQIDQFENPQHLMQLARSSEFSHLKHPFAKEVMTLTKAVALEGPVSEEKAQVSPLKAKLTLAVGAKQ